MLDLKYILFTVNFIWIKIWLFSRDTMDKCVRLPTARLALDPIRSIDSPCSWWSRTLLIFPVWRLWSYSISAWKWLWFSLDCLSSIFRRCFFTFLSSGSWGIYQNITQLMSRKHAPRTPGWTKWNLNLVLLKNQRGKMVKRKTQAVQHLLRSSDEETKR